jgi:hypothetical protein
VRHNYKTNGVLTMSTTVTWPNEGAEFRNGGTTIRHSYKTNGVLLERISVTSPNKKAVAAKRLALD